MHVNSSIYTCGISFHEFNWLICLCVTSEWCHQGSWKDTGGFLLLREGLSEGRGATWTLVSLITLPTFVWTHSHLYGRIWVTGVTIATAEHLSMRWSRVYPAANWITASHVCTYIARVYLHSCRLHIQLLVHLQQSQPSSELFCLFLTLTLTFRPLLQDYVKAWDSDLTEMFHWVLQINLTWWEER